MGAEANSTALESEAWHQRSDALTSAAAFIGILIGVIGGQAYASADDWAALLASGVIFTNGAMLLRIALAEVIGRVAFDRVDRRCARRGRRRGRRVGDRECRVRKAGLTYLVDIHVEVEGDLPVWRGHEIAHAVVDALKGKAPLNVSDVIVHIEPAPRSTSSAGCSEDMRPGNSNLKSISSVFLCVLCSVFLWG
ncbi:MAG: cation transporter dimerization domain-containing protein [Pyrinomonadaceae bacterium]